MASDKERAEKDESVCVVNVDLQKVMSLPQSRESILYYKRKLSVYNFTIYDMGTHDGVCNVWDETTAKRGGNEISSSIWKFIQLKSSQGVREFVFWSDNCIAKIKTTFVLHVLEGCHRFGSENYSQVCAKYFIFLMYFTQIICIT